MDESEARVIAYQYAIKFRYWAEYSNQGLKVVVTHALRDDNLKEVYYIVKTIPTQKRTKYENAFADVFPFYYGKCFPKSALSRE